MLNDQERSLVQRVWSQGVAPLYEEGFDADAIRVFLHRHDVQAEMQLLDQEHKHLKTIEARRRYITTRNMAKLSDGATAVIARAMAGPRYVRNPETGQILNDANGNPIVEQAEMTPMQMRAAEAVLDALGVGDHRKGNEPVHVEALQLNVMVETTEEAPDIEYDPDAVSEDQRALSRERVRNAILQLMPGIEDMRTEVQKSMAVKKPKRKRATKKTAKKATKKTTKKKVRKRPKL